MLSAVVFHRHLFASLQNEEGLWRQGRMRVAEGAGQGLCWNAGEFRVAYPSLTPQLCIGGVYIRFLLDGIDQVSQDPQHLHLILGSTLGWILSIFHVSG